jgi:hypothetical protein
MKRLAVLSAVLLSTNCAGVSVPPAAVNEADSAPAITTSSPTPMPAPISKAAPTVPSKATELLAREAVRRVLKDPASARFNAALQYPEAVCGFVNSKNAYGGYVGESPFIYVTATLQVYVLQHSGTDDERIGQLKALRRYCPD